MGKNSKNYYKRKGLGVSSHHQQNKGTDEEPSGWRYDSRGDKATFQSDAFDEYYNTQGLLPPEEWKKTLECLRTPLPTSFRVMDLGVSSGIVKEQAKKFQEEISKIHPGEFEELPFVEDGYQVNLPRPVLRAPLSGLKSFHEFLVNQGQAGVLMRQETVSMLPALALKGELKQDSLILDICSAPGSKTSQLLEMLNECPRPDASKPPEGMVVANELVVKRAHLLIHRLRHHNSPNLLVTAHAGQSFPSCFDGVTGQRIEFDAALCDAPCSGDGTLRKSPDLWSRWHPNAGLSCHRLQRSILKRTATLVKVGGVIVYSTCALNPIEDEAVVGSVVAASEGALELGEWKEAPKGLKYEKGVSSWKVKSGGRW